MVPPLPPENVKEIFEYLQDDLGSLYSCMFVNRQWAQVAVEILWRDTMKFRDLCYSTQHVLKILSTLISCLPKESKDILRGRGIKIPITARPPSFDYAGMCRYLEFTHINNMIDSMVSSTKLPDGNKKCNKKLIPGTMEYCKSGTMHKYTKYLIKQELYKMFISRCSTLKKLEYRDKDILLPCFRNAEICLSNLCELHCNSSLPSGTFYQMSLICKNLAKIIIDDCTSDNEGLATLIKVQNNLKSVKIIVKGNALCKGKLFSPGRFNRYDVNCRYTNIADAISFQSKSLTHFHIGGKLLKAIPPENISSLVNLQSLSITFHDDIENILTCSTFPKLKVLELKLLPMLDHLIQFISRTEGHLEIIHFEVPCVYPFYQIPLFNQTVVKCCPNIRYLNTWFYGEDVSDFKKLLIGCRNLEAISIATYRYDDETYEAHINEFLEILEVLEIDLKLRLKLCKIEFYYSWGIDIDVLEVFLRKRKERNQDLEKHLQQPLLSFYFHNSFLKSDIDFSEYMELKFKQFKKECLIKDFGIKKYDDFR
ncbi:14567_t:CDS:1 [Acaulospora morrowiae]|uniref:14567_t:CDS:1 n=1 Tax=Acaulospora morrowiae TaxID=94023 RepID=A0A9N9FB60_9GLOM|nr:14567_t:CDS:1 [Acaulospora morrowiae]